MFNFLKKKKLVTGEDKNGVFFNVKITKNEEMSEDAFKELSCGTGNDYDYITNEGEVD